MILRLIYVIRLNRKWLIQQQQESTCNEFFAEKRGKNLEWKTRTDFNSYQFMNFGFWCERKNTIVLKAKKKLFHSSKTDDSRIRSIFFICFATLMKFPSKSFRFSFGVVLGQFSGFLDLFNFLEFQKVVNWNF